MSESPNDFRNIVAFKGDDAVRKALGRAADELESALTENRGLIDTLEKVWKCSAVGTQPYGVARSAWDRAPTRQHPDSCDSWCPICYTEATESAQSRQEQPALDAGWKKEVHHKGTLHETTVWRSPDGSVQGVPPVQSEQEKGSDVDSFK